MDSKTATFLARAVLIISFIIGLVDGFRAIHGYNDGSFWWEAIVWWASGLAVGMLLYGVSAALEYLEEILHHVHRIRFPEEGPSKAKLGNSRMSLDALKDFKLESKEE